MNKKIVFYDKSNIDHILFVGMLLYGEYANIFEIKNYSELYFIPNDNDYEFIFLEYLPKNEWFTYLANNNIGIISMKLYSKNLLKINTNNENNVVENVYDSVLFQYNGNLIKNIYCGKLLCNYWNNNEFNNSIEFKDSTQVKYLINIFVLSYRNESLFVNFDYFFNIMLKNIKSNYIKNIYKFYNLANQIYFDSTFIQNKFENKLYQINDSIDYLLIEKQLLNENIDNTINVIIKDKELFLNNNESNYFKIIKINTTDIEDILSLINMFINHFKNEFSNVKIDCLEIYNIFTKQSIYIPNIGVSSFNNYEQIISYYNSTNGQNIKNLLLTYHKVYNSNENIQLIENDYINPYLTIYNTNKINLYTNSITQYINFNFYKNILNG